MRWKKYSIKKEEEANNERTYFLVTAIVVPMRCLRVQPILDILQRERREKISRNNVNIKKRAFNSIQGKYLRWAKNWFLRERFIIIELDYKWNRNK